MAESAPVRRNRLTSIDMLRGLVLVIMALDHTRDMVMRPLSTDYGAAVDFATSGAALFFTRLVTHLCAPTFVLLAGVSAYLYGATGKRPTVEITRFLLSRGIWLVFIELTVIQFAWAFNLTTMHILQVIWAIGWSMIVLSALAWLPRMAIGAFGALMIVTHNGLDSIQPLLSEASPLWVIFHIPGRLTIGTWDFLVIYPLIPWIGVMALGYAMGPYFVGENPQRRRRLLQAGALLTLSFMVLRLTNLYGDPVKWVVHQNGVDTLISFLSVTKYPVSLQFLLLTLGPALMLLGYFERVSGGVAQKLVTIGHVSFFFYVVHFYVIHSIAVLIGLWQGLGVRDMAVFFLYYPAQFGLSLAGVYVVWGAVILAMYPACVWFAGVKARRRDWWLSYL
ncbi:MAG: DUF1624 domain-containing protein [Syntrophaceae bacterium]